MATLLIDLDGVVYEGDRLVPGAREALRWADGEGLRALFLTNTTSRPRSALVDKLAGLGIATRPEQIFTPPVAAARWLADQAIDRVALFVPKATAAEFGDFDVLAAGEERGAEAVVVGDLGTEWNFATLNRAFRLLMNEPRPKLIALGMTRYWRSADGLRLDAAPFVMALAHASGADPLVLGKPAVEFFSAALAVARSTPRDAVMIGDDIRVDVGGAQAAGIRALLVRTGKYRPEDLAAGITPDGVLDSLAGLPEWWRNAA